MSIPGICINSYKIAQGALFAAWVTFCHMVTEVSFIGCGKVTECASLFEYVFLFFVLQKDVITSCHEVAEVTLFAVGHDVVVGLCNLVHGSHVNHVLVALKAGSLKINVCYYLAYINAIRYLVLYISTSFRASINYKYHATVEASHCYHFAKVITVTK